LRPAPLEAIWQAACHAAAEIPGTEAATVAAHAATSAATTHASILQQNETKQPGGDQSVMECRGRACECAKTEKNEASTSK
jgi:hypothetical protein